MPLDPESQGVLTVECLAALVCLILLAGAWELLKWLHRPERVMAGWATVKALGSVVGVLLLLLACGCLLVLLAHAL